MPSPVLLAEAPPPNPAQPPLSNETSFAETLNELVEGFSEQVAVVDEDWTILAVNDAWRHMVRVSGYEELKPGINYRLFLQTFAGKGHANAQRALAGIHEIGSGASHSFAMAYSGVDQWEGRTLQLRINRLHIAGHAVATIARQDVTASAELRRLREHFSSSVMESQAEERRRFSRELHDSTAQLLASVGLLLTTLKRQSPFSEAVGIVDELQELVDETRQEIRSISYLAHPPALEKMTLADAMKTLVEGFARRTHLDMSFSVHGRRARLAPSAENALYRVAQEAISNVHRHARANKARVFLCFRKSFCHLVLMDDGIGISAETASGKGTAGVGMLGMRSRLSEIGGRLTIRNLSPGTLVVATVRASRPRKHPR